MSRKKIGIKSNLASSDRNPEKEAFFKQLVESIQQSGYQVRREELKRGNGWVVSSGSCRLLDSKIIFVDKRLSQDDQIALLLSFAYHKQVSFDLERFQGFSGQLVAKIEAIRATSPESLPG